MDLMNRVNLWRYLIKLKKIKKNFSNICTRNSCDVWKYCKGGCRYQEIYEPKLFFSLCKLYKKIIKISSKYN